MYARLSPGSPIWGAQIIMLLLDCASLLSMYKILSRYIFVKPLECVSFVLINMLMFPSLLFMASCLDC